MSRAHVTHVTLAQEINIEKMTNESIEQNTLMDSFIRLIHDCFNGKYG